MTPDDLDRIDTLAEAATPGKWTWQHSNWGTGSMTLAFQQEQFHDHNILKTTDDWPPNENDAAFIAACDPATVRGLVARIRELEGERARDTELIVDARLAAVSHGDCICKPPPLAEAPAEDCPQHGRDYAWWVGCANAKVEQLQAAEARVAELIEKVTATDMEATRWCVKSCEADERAEKAEADLAALRDAVTKLADEWTKDPVLGMIRVRALRALLGEPGEQLQDTDQ